MDYLRDINKARNLTGSYALGKPSMGASVVISTYHVLTPPPYKYLLVHRKERRTPFFRRGGSRLSAPSLKRILIIAIIINSHPNRVVSLLLKILTLLHSGARNRDLDIPPLTQNQKKLYPHEKLPHPPVTKGAIMI